MIRFEIKKFEEFSIKELYSVLNLRADVFVVEQKSIYLDLDFKDQQALHILGYVKEKLVAYSRIFKSDESSNFARIGRVVIANDYRKHNFGHDLVTFSIKSIGHVFNEYNIYISAQLHLMKFYQFHGFVVVGEQYLEDGIPHIGMEIIKKQ